MDPPFRFEHDVVIFFEKKNQQTKLFFSFFFFFYPFPPLWFLESENNDHPAFFALENILVTYNNKNLTYEYDRKPKCGE